MDTPATTWDRSPPSRVYPLGRENNQPKDDAKDTPLPNPKVAPVVNAWLQDNSTNGSPYDRSATDQIWRKCCLKCASCWKGFKKYFCGSEKIKPAPQDAAKC